MLLQLTMHHKMMTNAEFLRIGHPDNKLDWSIRLPCAADVSVSYFG